MPSFGPSAQDADNRGAATARLINCYRQPVMGQGRTLYVLKSVLGTEAFADVGQVFFGGAYEFKNDIYAAYDGRLHRIGVGGMVDEVGTISSGDADLSSNNDYVTVAAGGSYFTVLGGVSQVTPGPFSLVGSVDYLDQYTLITEKNGRRWAWSSLADPTDIPALNFASAEATDDNLLRVIGLNGRVVLFKETGREVWYNTNQSNENAFLRLAGGARNIGLKSFKLITRTDEALFWIGNDNIARLTLDGLGEQKFSYPPVDTAIANNDPTECFYTEDEGQKFCHIRFSDRASYVLDLATGEWHERAEGATHEPWSIRGSVKLGSNWYGLTDTGLIQRFTRNNADVVGPLKRTAISPTFYEEEGASLDELEIYARTGFEDIGRDVKIWVRLSRDGGHRWTLEKVRDLGNTGNYAQKATWRHQGAFQQLTIEANMSDPVEVPLWAEFRMEAA